jgi:phage baseplate assembly protein gpV
MSRGIPSNSEDQIADLYRRVAELERRIQNQKRTGKVLKVDPAKGIQVELDVDPVTGQRDSTDWIPWQEQSMGGTKSHFPPSVGEQVDISSETGDGHDWRATFSTPSDDNKRPFDTLDRNGWVREKSSITWGDDWIEFKVAAAYVRITPDKITAHADTIEAQAAKLFHVTGLETFIASTETYHFERLRIRMATESGPTDHVFAKP